MSTNELLERYLQAVKFWLPKAQQQDILAELAEDLRSQIEEREDALGQVLDENEMVALLKRRGDPIRVASGYIPQQRLVDPAIVPVYRLVLKIVLLWVLAPMFALMWLGAAFTVPHPEVALANTLFLYLQSGFMTIGIVTLVFAVFDRYQVKFSGVKWDPRKLPRVTLTTDSALRWNRLASSVFGFAAAIFWIWVGNAGYLISETSLGGGVHILPAAVWQIVYWTVLGTTLIDASADFASFLDPPFGRTRSMIRIGLDAVSIIVAAWLVNAPNWVTVTVDKLNPDQMAKVMIWVNGSIRFTILSIVVIALIDAFVNVRRLMGHVNRSLTEIPPVHL